MMEAILSIGGWTLVAIGIFFWAHWNELERELFDHWRLKRGHLE
jgi:hypothetical protein